LSWDDKLKRKKVCFDSLKRHCFPHQKNEDKFS